MRAGGKTNRISIGEISRLAGVKVETIRYYERVGLLDEPSRTAGGNRIYGKEDVSRLRFIRRCRELGFSVADVRSLLALSDHDEPDCDRTREITWRQLQAVRARIASLTRLEQTLEAMTSACKPEQQQERCPIIESLNAE